MKHTCNVHQEQHRMDHQHMEQYGRQHCSRTHPIAAPTMKNAAIYQQYTQNNSECSSISFTSLLASDVQFQPITYREDDPCQGVTLGDSDFVRVSVTDHGRDVIHKYSINSCSRPVLYNVNDIEIKQENTHRQACTRVWQPKMNTPKKLNRYVIE